MKIFESQPMIGQLSIVQMKELLASCVTGHLGFSDGRKVYVLPINYIYEGQYLLAHSANGLKVQVMRQHPHVCFEVEMITGPDNWSTVMAWGTYQELHDERDRYNALNEFLKKRLYFNLHNKVMPKEENDPSGILSMLTGNFRAIIFRIIIDEMTGRFARS